MDGTSHALRAVVSIVFTAPGFFCVFVPPNTQQEVTNLINMGVDSICTDEPRLVIPS